MAREPAHIHELRRALGHFLSVWRQKSGWSQSRFADELHYHRTAISHLEAGRHPAPREFWAHADRLLAAGGTLLQRYDDLATAKLKYFTDAACDSIDDGDTVLSAAWTHQGTVAASVALRERRSHLGRRRFTLLTGATMTAFAHRWLIRDPEPLVSGLSGGRISEALADQLSTMITTLRAMDDTAGGGVVLSLAEQAFGWVAGLLDQASYGERTGHKLYIALAELGQLAGWVAHDSGQPGLGQRYHVAALHAAHSADDRRLGAHILGCMADQAARQGRAADAVTLTESAVAGIRGQETPRLLAELYIRKAYALATLRDGSRCTAAISKARRQIEKFEPDSDPPWLYWVTSAEITAGAGDCLLRLGEPARAVGLFDTGIAMFDQAFVRDRQVYLTHSADALARPGKQHDLEAAVEQGREAIRLAESLTSTRGMDCLRDLCTQIRPYAVIHPVRDFLEQACGVLATQGTFSAAETCAGSG